MSYAWTEIGLSADEYVTHAQRISASLKDIWLVRKIVFLQVVPAFAFNSFIAIATAGMAMPDWYYDNEYISKKMKRWSNGLFVFSFINPFWWLGLPLSYLFAFKHYMKVKKAILFNAQAIK